MAMRVFIAGGTGYIGTHVVKQLINDGYSVRLFLRKGSESNLDKPILENAELMYGDINEQHLPNNALEGCDAVIYLIGILRESTSRDITYELAHVHGVRLIHEQAVSSRVKRWIHISANGVRPDTEKGYIRTKYIAEEFIKAQALDYTIIRPSIVFGDETASTINFTNTVKGIAEMLPFVVPVIGNGRYKFQPVHVDDLSKAISMIITDPTTYHKTYTACGAETITYNQIVDTIIKHFVINKKLKLHIPLTLIKLFAKMFEHLESFPVTSEQVNLLIKGNTCTEYNLIEKIGINQKCFSSYY